MHAAEIDGANVHAMDKASAGRTSPELSAANFARVLGHPLRISVVRLLANRGSMSFTSLMEALHVSQGLLGNHLARLLDGGVIACQKSGRISWYSVPDARIAEAVENLFGAAGAAPMKPAGPPSGMCFARRCTDHVGGLLGVRLLDWLIRNHVIALDGNDYRVIGAAGRFEPLLGDVMHIGPTSKKIAVGCLDTTEGRDHLGGVLGARLLSGLRDLGWAEEIPGSRTLILTCRGVRQLSDLNVIDASEFPQQDFGDGVDAATEGAHDGQ